MSKFSFLNIPEEYQANINQISNEVIKKLYSKFDFLYFPFKIHIENEDEKDTNNGNSNNQSKIYSFLVDYLTNFKFITYHIININKANSLANENREGIINSIICVENHCIFVEEITIQIMHQIISTLKEKQISVINFTNKNKNFSSLEEQRANEEVKNFILKFKPEIDQNGFVKITIPSIVGFLIRRYFYPSSFFKDPSFFNFIKSNESILSQKFENFLFSNKEKDNSKNLPKLSLMINLIRSNKENYEKQDFEEKDFIILRTIFSNDKFVFYFVIHIKSFYVFMMKKMIHPADDSKEKEHEITFCENYSHRCLTRFYGFLKERNRIVGFIYEFMPNGSLNSFVSSTKENISNDFLLMTIYRLLQGLDYLHSNSLIHRDIKPSNILLNHDFIPFISDFETVRQISKDDEKSDSNFTVNIGSVFYSSPEQYHGKAVSFSADVFSFGLIVYFLFEKKNLISNYSFFDDLNNFDKNLPSLQTDSELFQLIFKQCVKYSPDERIKLHEIEQNVFNKSFKFDFLEQFLLKNEISFEKERILTQFLYEVCLNLNNDVGLIMKMLLYILNFHFLFMIKKEDGESEFLLSLGQHYINGQEIEQNYLKAKKFFELAADLGSSNAFLNLGILYANGLGVEQDFTKAIKYFEVASQKNNAEAMSNLGIFYFNGNGVEKDYLKARNYFELSAQLGNSNANLNLGLLYSDGLGVKQDYLKAKEYYEKAAQFNNSNAIFNLGNLYFYGRGVEQSYSKAKEYYELSATLGNSVAIFNIGELYFYGNGVDKDYFKAKHFYELAAQYGNDDALYSLGYLYKKGFGTQKNYLKAKEYFELAAEQENSKAILNLGILYANGEGVPKNYLKAKEYFELASNLNNSDGLVNLGTLFLHGFGVEKNYEKAKEYYELAAKQNNSTALVILGNIYSDGLGVANNYEKAREYYELAAKQNDSKSYLNLGYLYYYGLGVAKDFLKAKDYYEKSAQLGNSAAILNLGYLYLNGNGVKIDYLKTKQYFELLAEKKDPNGLYELGELYFNGEGIEKDYKKAKEYFELSANQYNSDALVKLGEIYFYGYGVESNYLKSIGYFELAAKYNDPRSLFYLGLIYSTGDDFYFDIPKAIHYFTRCSNIHSQHFQFFNQRENIFSTRFNFNEYLYRSSNDLGLIYLLILNDVEKASEFLKKAAYAEYPFAQNNLGLFNQFFLNDIENAKYMYKRSSEHKFALADFNLGLLAEKENDLNKTIEYYIKASDNENEPLIFHQYKHIDKRLEISKIFIICLTNLKLVDFYIKQSENDEAKKYFIKAFHNLQLDESYKFKFEFINNRFSYLKTFILNHPIFNLKNQPNLNLKDSQIDLKEKKDTKSSSTFTDVDIKFRQDMIQIKSNEKQNSYKESGDLFDIIISKNELKNYFIEDLKDIIDEMNEILFTPPYLILFGRISLVKQESKKNVELNSEQKLLNNSFYEGFGGEDSLFCIDDNK